MEPTELFPPPTIVHLAVVDSTQRAAFALAGHGAADRTVVVAASQTAGRGRRGRVWRDTPGECLLASIVVRPRLATPDWPKLSLVTAVAVAEAVEAVAGVAPRLKWPNDVLVGGRKIAGILLESRVGAPPVVVVGVGINLGQRALPPELDETATSVWIASGRDVTPDAMLEALLGRFDAWRARLENDGFEPVRTRWLALADTIGRRVVVDGRDGVAVDLDADGALVVRGEDGARHVVAGELHDRGGALDDRGDGRGD